MRAARVLVELSDTLTREFDIDEFTATFAARCVELLPAHGAAVLLNDERQGVRIMASTDDRVHLLELLEIQASDGPCLESLRTGTPLFNVLLPMTTAVWPAFTAEAVRLGFPQLHAVPMRRGDQVIGVVDLFAKQPWAMSVGEMKLAQAMSEAATIAILHDRGLRHARDLARQLQAALDSRVSIEQAKGMLAERLHVDVDTAFVILRQHARRSNRRLNDLARDVVDGKVHLADAGPVALDPPGGALRAQPQQRLNLPPVS